MAGGPLFPFSVVPISEGDVFANLHFDTAGEDFYIEGIGVIATGPATDATVELFFQMPEDLPAGTAKLCIWAIADAVTGSAKVNPKWKAKAADEALDETAKTAEGTVTFTWAADDDHKPKQEKVTLDAATIAAGDLVDVDLVFEASGYDLAVIGTFWAYIIWE